MFHVLKANKSTKRDTGPKNFFEVTRSKALKIYQEAIRKVSGLARTVRGPTMSTLPGKSCVGGVSQIGKEKVFILNMLQSRNPELVGSPFFAKYEQQCK
jgi:hypothetical protein